MRYDAHSMRNQVHTLGNHLGLKEEALLWYLHSFNRYFDHPYLHRSIFPAHLRGTGTDGTPRFLKFVHQELELTEKVFTTNSDEPNQFKKRTLPSNEWFSDPKNARGLIVAKTGYGKSTLLRAEAVRLAQEGLGRLKQGWSASEIHLPLLVTFKELAIADAYWVKHHKEEASSHLRFQAALIQAATRSLSGSEASVRRFKALLRESINNGQCSVFLDSWDEAGKQGRKGDLADLLESWLSLASPNLRVHATSRERQHTEIDLNQIVELRGFPPLGAERSESSIQNFTKGWLGGEAVPAGISTVPNIASMAEVPLLLAFMCKVHEASSTPVRTKTELYSKVLEGITREWMSKTKKDRLKRKFSKLNQEGVYEEWLSFLSTAAFRIFQSRDEAGGAVDWHEALEVAIKEEYSSEKLSKIKKMARKQLAFWSEDGCGLLTGSTPMEPYHSSLFEFLAAHHLADKFSREESMIQVEIVGQGQQEIPLTCFMEKKAWDITWAEVFALTAGILGQRQKPAPFIDRWADPSEDDLLRTRLAMACEAEKEYSGSISVEGKTGEALAIYFEEQMQSQKEGVPLPRLLKFVTKSLLRNLSRLIGRGVNNWAAETIKGCGLFHPIEVSQALREESLRLMEKNSTISSKERLEDLALETLWASRPRDMRLSSAGQDQEKLDRAAALASGLGAYDVRIITAISIAEIGALSATPRILQDVAIMLRDSESSVKLWGAAMVAILGGQAATHEFLQSLTAMLRDEDELTNYYAVLAIAHIGPSAQTCEIIEALELALNKNSLIEKAALEAICTLARGNPDIINDKVICRLEAVQAHALDMLFVRDQFIRVRSLANLESCLEFVENAL